MKYLAIFRFLDSTNNEHIASCILDTEEDIFSSLKNAATSLQMPGYELDKCYLRRISEFDDLRRIIQRFNSPHI